MKEMFFFFVIFDKYKSVGYEHLQFEFIIYNRKWYMNMKRLWNRVT